MKKLALTMILVILLAGCSIPLGSVSGQYAMEPIEAAKQSNSVEEFTKNLFVQSIIDDDMQIGEDTIQIVTRAKDRSGDDYSQSIKQAYAQFCNKITGQLMGSRCGDYFAIGTKFIPNEVEIIGIGYDRYLITVYNEKYLAKIDAQREAQRLAEELAVSEQERVALEQNAELLKKAEAGEPMAQFELGLMYYEGIGVPQNYEKAAEWVTKAANQEFDMAQSNLGFMYSNGQGVPQNYEKAAEWYTKAANQGFDRAQSNLGIMYHDGKGVPQNHEKAVEWYTKAASQGNTIAQSNLGFMYLNGRGVPQDLVTGCAWIYLSNDQQNVNFCDSRLNQAQMTRTLHLMEELKKDINRLNQARMTRTLHLMEEELNRFSEQ